MAPTRPLRSKARELLHSTTNLYFGNDPSKWRQAVPNYGRVQVQGAVSAESIWLTTATAGSWNTISR